MKLVEATTDDVTVVEVYGRVDSTTAKAFGDRLVGLVHGGAERILVDLQNIVYISSAGFRALLIASKASAERQGKLVLCGVSGEVKRLFEIGAFTELFQIYPTQADGIGRLKQ
jgi:anti-anti-sigma factor